MLRPLRFFLGDLRLFLKYISAGAIAAVVELSLFSAFHLGLGWPLLVANSLALAVGVLTCFVLQRTWTFRARDQLTRQFRLYLLMQGISFLFNNGLVYLFIDQWGWYPLPAKVLQIGLVFIWNFSFCKLVVFRAAYATLRRTA